MFDRAFITDFFHFLEKASPDELESRLARLSDLILGFRTDSDVYKDACFLKRKIQEELLARTCLNRSAIS